MIFIFPIFCPQFYFQKIDLVRFFRQSQSVWVQVQGGVIYLTVQIHLWTVDIRFYQILNHELKSVNVRIIGNLYILCHFLVFKMQTSIAADRAAGCRAIQGHRSPVLSLGAKLIVTNQMPNSSRSLMKWDLGSA